MIEWFAEWYRDVRVIEEPQGINVIGAQGTQASWSYIHELDDGQTWHLKIHSLLFFRFPRVHTFHLVHDCSQLYLSPETIRKFVKTIEYTQI